MKETAKRHAAALNRGVKRTRAGALLDDKGEVQPLISPEDFEKQQFDKEAEKAKQKKLRALKKEESLGSQGSASSFDFFKRGGSESPKKKKGKRPMSPAEKQGVSAKSKASKTQKTPKVAAAFAGGSGGLTFRSRAKQSRFIERVQKTQLGGTHKIKSFESESWQEQKSGLVFKARDRLEALLNEDANWMLFANGPSLTEEGLTFRLNLQKSSEKLGVIGTVLEAQETRTAKASGAQRPAHVHSLRDAVARVDAWNKLNVSHKVKVHADLQEQVLREVVDECCEEMNIKEMLFTTALDDTLAAPFRHDDGATLETSIRSVEGVEARRELQHDLWVAALTSSFRDKDDTALLVGLCKPIQECPSGFFATDGVVEDVKAVDALIKWFLSGQNPDSSTSFAASRERCKSSSKLMRQWCNLPLGIEVLKSIDECGELARKVAFYNSKLVSIRASLKTPVTGNMGNVEAFRRLCQQASRVKHDFSCLLAGAGEEFSKLKETEIREVVRFLETCVADLCRLRMKVIDSSLSTAICFVGKMLFVIVLRAFTNVWTTQKQSRIIIEPDNQFLVGYEFEHASVVLSLKAMHARAETTKIMIRPCSRSSVKKGKMQSKPR